MVNGIYMYMYIHVRTFLMLTFDWQGFMFSEGHHKSGKVARIPMVLVFSKLVNKLLQVFEGSDEVK